MQTILMASKKRCSELQDEVDKFKPTSARKFLLDDEKVKYYTGLSTYNHFASLLKYLQPDNNAHNNSSLNNETQFLLVLMMLRHNLRRKDLAYRFGISKTTVSRFVLKWIEIMYVKLQPILEKAWEWSSNEETKKTIPACFRQRFPDLKVIIDCFEILCDSPRALQLDKNAASVSSNKHQHTTVKTLVGITPHGCPSFISKSFVGQVTEKQMVIDSGLIPKLKKGDQVLAFRDDFTIQDLLKPVGATLVTPRCKGKESQPSSHLAVKESREASNVPNHIERIIDLAKNRYSILRGPLKPYTSKVDETGIAFIEKVITVAFAMINLGPTFEPVE